MGVKLNLIDIMTGIRSAAGIANNNTLTEEAMDKALDRTANVDNAMQVDLDMGQNNIINVDKINGEDISGFSGNITTVAEDIDNINTVADNLNGSNTIGTVSSNIADVNTVAGISSDVTAVAGIEADVTAVATNNADVTTVADNIAAVNNTSDNIDDVVSFSILYLGSKAADPSLDNEGNPLVEGAMYFNTVSDNMFVYDGSAWQAGAFIATDAIGVDYNNSSSGLEATNVQAAIDEMNVGQFYPDIFSVGTDDFASNPTAITYFGPGRVVVGNNDGVFIARFDGQVWTQEGPAYSIMSGNIEGLATLDENLVAMIRSDETLSAIFYDGATWTQYGNELSIGGSISDFADITALDNSTVAVFDTLNDTLKTYAFDGMDWAQQGNTFSSITPANAVYLEAVSPSRIIMTYDDVIQVLDFDGTDWTAGASATTFSGENNAAFTFLTETDLVVIGVGAPSSDELAKVMRFDGTSFSDVTDSIPLYLGDFSGIAIAGVGPNTFAATNPSMNKYNITYDKSTVSYTMSKIV